MGSDNKNDDIQGMTLAQVLSTVLACSTAWWR
jgi:hypothetical protein